MFEGLKKAITQVQPEKNNLLNQIVYPYLNDNLVVWYNNFEAETFINKGYRGNATVYSIVRKIGDKEKIAPLQVFKEKNRLQAQKYKSFKQSIDHQAASKVIKTKALELAEDNDLAKLLKYPNPYQSQTEFFEAASGFYRTTGEFFIYGVGPGDDSKNFGKYTELYVLPSHLVEIVQGSTLDPVKGYKLKIGNQSLTIDAKDVLHMKMWNPLWDIQGSQLRGQSPLLAGLKYLTKNDSALFAATKAMQNEGAKGIVSPNHPDPKLWLTPTQVEATEAAMDSKLNGSDNQHKVAVSGMPLQYTQIGLSPVALAIIESMANDEQKLCGCWGISPLLFSPVANYANLKEAQKAMVTDVVIPYLNNLETALNRWLCPAFSQADGVTYTVDFDTSVYPELQMDLQVLKTVYGDAWQVSGNEYRNLLNLDEDPKYDVNLVQSGLTPLDMVMNPPEPENQNDELGDYSGGGK